MGSFVRTKKPKGLQSRAFGLFKAMLIKKPLLHIAIITFREECKALNRDQSQYQ